MIIETLSVFPQMFAEVVGTSIIGRARAAGALEFIAHDLRDWTHDKHHTTDDEPYGGGQGQLFKPEPVFEALDELLTTPATAALAVPASTTSVSATDAASITPASAAATPAILATPIASATAAATTTQVIFFTPHGRRFDQKLAQELADYQRLIMVCGRYEGFDDRVYTRADQCISLGDYILTGGELPAMVVTDAVCRLLPGVLGNEASNADESFMAGLLEYPQYTRPATYRGLTVPEVLLSGNHAAVAAWRRQMSIIRTAQFRPDLLMTAELSDQERQLAKQHIQSDVIS